MLQKTILMLCLIAIFVGCQTTTTESDRSAISTGTWQCRDAPEIHISVIDYTDELVYCEISGGLEVGSGAMSVIQFVNMVNDGRWQRVLTRGPMLGPPPPGWSDADPSDRIDGTGIRIDGSISVVFYIYTPLPVHDEIHVTEPIAARR